MFKCHIFAGMKRHSIYLTNVAGVQVMGIDAIGVNEQCVNRGLQKRGFVYYKKNNVNIK